jgi:AcrR family transcriptional regulator
MRGAVDRSRGAAAGSTVAGGSVASGVAAGGGRRASVAAVSLGGPRIAGSGALGRSVPRSQVAEIQRSRLLAAAVSVFDERGYAGTTVAHITRYARVSRRTFYELFANREECLAAVIEDAVSRVQAELSSAELQRLSWCERIRTGLAAVLAFLDREPALARVCVVQAARGGPVIVSHREQILQDLAAAIDEGRFAGGRGGECSPLTAEGLAGAGFAIVYTRLLRCEREPLGGLLGELMGMVVLPYLGPGAARREQTRRAPVVLGGPAGRLGSGRPAGDPLEGVQMRMTYRTARVLEGIAEHPGASNRMVSDYAGIQDQGQVSKLLARLLRLGLVTKSGDGHAKGEPNAWRLTFKGEQVAQSIRLHRPNESRAA